MIFKTGAADAKVDWEAVRLATEIPRTYLIRTKSGGILFKMYKPSEMKRILNDPNDIRNLKWEDVKLYSRKA